MVKDCYTDNSSGRNDPKERVTGELAKLAVPQLPPVPDDADAKEYYRCGRSKRGTQPAQQLYNVVERHSHSARQLLRKVTPVSAKRNGHARASCAMRWLREDSDERVREKAVFALSVSKEPEALDAMVAAARDDRSARVRGQALFWLAQKAGKKAAGAITEAIARDPETEVKKRAVFALSQLPKDEGVPLLIEVARTNKNPVVRKQAIFWLGQSNDPRALKFFEEVLK
jgi:HEAT repeat protein